MTALRYTTLCALVAGCFGAGISVANPVGPQVANGQASFVTQGKVLSIANTPGAIINWQNFSINPDEVTRFLQQNAGSSVLNRITGQDPSTILGALQSNGKVFLINPNGIVFGPGAQVNVNGLVASTLGITNQDFIAGKLKFGSGDSAGKVHNQGVITTPAGGQVYLIAPHVENNGIITSPKGDVMLAAGHSVELVDSTNPAVQVVISAPADQALNLGQIVAQGGKIGIYGALINQRGVVNANSAVVGENGKIILKASRDTILDAGSQTTATGQGKGGDIQILGERVGLTGNATVDASGKTGGGTILVGGDYHGDNAAVQNASRTFVGGDTQIRADAIDTGDGGKVIVWSDDATRAYGTFSARGGANGGNGGFVETSGKQSLDFRAKVDVSAARGKGGTLLLDPSSITIAGGTGDGASDGTSSFQGSSVGTVNFSDGSPTTIYQSELEGITASNIVLEATNYIDTSGTFFSNVVNISPNTNLTMRTRNAATDSSPTRGIDLTAASPSLEFKTSGFGTITLQTGTGASPQPANINVGKLTTAGGKVTIISSGTTNVAGIVTTPLSVGAGGDVAISSTGSITLGSPGIDASGASSPAGDATLSSDGEIGMAIGSRVVANNVKLAAATGIHGATTTDYFSIRGNAINALNTGSGDIRITSSASNFDIADIGSVGYGIRQQASGAGVFLTSDDGRSLNINAPVTATTGTINLTGSSGLVQSVAGTITSTGGAVNLGVNAVDMLLSTASGATINSGNGDITLRSDKMDLGGTVNAGTGIATLQANASAITHLATVATDLTSATLELSAAELNRVTASRLRIGQNSGGDIDLKGALLSGTGGALQNISTSVSLNSGSNITQQTGATISGGSALQVRGANVSLTESNGTGVVSGSSSTGNFEYKSPNLLTVSTVDGYAGISAASNINLVSTSSLGINQSGGSPITGQQLALDTPGPVSLQNTSNSVAAIAANLNPGGIGTGSFNLFNSGSLAVGGPFNGITGITTKNQPIILTTGTGATTSINAAISAGTSTVSIVADQLSLGPATITGSEVSLRPFSGGRKITVGASTCTIAPCLNLVDLYKVSAPSLIIGSSGQADSAGEISVAGLTNTGSAAITDRNAGTTRVTLQSAGGIAQTGSISVQDLAVNANGVVSLGLANNINNVAGKSSGDFTIVNSPTLNISSFSGGVSPYAYNLSGVTATGGNISLASSTGNLNVGGVINAGVGNVALNAGAAIVQAGGNIVGGGLNAVATGGIGNGTALVTQIGSLSATNSGANTDIKISNTGALVLQNLAQSTPGSTGSIIVDNVGATSIKAGTSVSTKAGNIRLSTHSPLTVDGSVTSANGGAITLEAGPTGNANDVLTVNAIGTVSTTGAVLLRAGDAINTTGSVTGGTITRQAFLNSPIAPPPPPPAPPTLSQCTANPKLVGCSTILPTIAQCIASPTIAGCSAVLPTAAECTVTPTLAGCVIVNPSLAQCIAAPTLPNCGAVLPSLAQCIAVPSTAGCSAVLPTFAQCQSVPTTSGCAAVLPSIGQCVATPLLSGCNSVLPSLSECLANLTLPGCSAVLPTVSQCITSPALAGCSTILPSLSQCIATPSLTGCSVVLPTLAQCLVAPTRTGCSIALPTLAQCTATPTLAGCSTILPGLSQCIASPTLPGCTVVLPSITQCTTTPTLTGCTVVLPALVQCIATPALAGCSAVLPTSAQCSISPSLPGCPSVAPTLAQCVATPGLSGCSAVLPSISQCVATPTLPGCSVVLPTTAQCSINPGLIGCSPIPPTTTVPPNPTVPPTTTPPPTTSVPPTFTQCISNPVLAGCESVLPTAVQCSAAPALAGCNVVIATISQCATNPTLPGCSTTLPVTLRSAVNSAISPLLATVSTSNNIVGIPGLINQVGGRPTPAENDVGNNADGANGAGPKNSGAKKDEAVKKMYCN